MLNRQYKVAIIGAGAAGIGMSVALKQYGLKDHIVLEKGQVGNSFQHWNTQTRFISPSFTTNGFGVPDLNAVTPTTSPAFTLLEEHPSGPEYQAYLNSLVDYYQLPVEEHADVVQIEKAANDQYHIHLADHSLIVAEYVIIALGDYSFPDTANIKNAQLGRHYRDIKAYDQFIGQGPQTIIGGNESAFDLATHLAALGIQSTLYTAEPAFNLDEPDPSKRLSTYTFNNFQPFESSITVKNDAKVVQIEKIGDQYQLDFANGAKQLITSQPLLATGFSNTQSKLVKDLFAVENARAVLNDEDESTRAKNVFMVGPEVVHGQVILCYVYKYRQRFAPLAELILRRDNQPINTEVAEQYRINNMYLKNLSNCAVDCDC